MELRYALIAVLVSLAAGVLVVPCGVLEAAGGVVDAEVFVCVSDGGGSDDAEDEGVGSGVLEATVVSNDGRNEGAGDVIDVVEPPDEAVLEAGGVVVVKRELDVLGVLGESEDDDGGIEVASDVGRVVGGGVLDSGVVVGVVLRFVVFRAEVEGVDDDSDGVRVEVDGVF